ncbi:MAG TPA: riboflavin synthase [Kiritimatiellia bacterium]|nr:riboflavin synthase [Kiritimatiellia bacterium]HMO97958.1 riboflavin synthase [Kiritimatiellia bacterium]HMP95309.1 riboflavin synthase [Kiritimatiellia bacterium]
MFSGIIQKVGTLQEVIRHADGSGRLVMCCDPWPEPVAIGESIANNGVCLTVTGVSGHSFSFDLLDETFNKTNLGSLRPGDLINLERALRVGDVIGGHFVTGHVDGVGETSAWEPHGRDFIWRIRCPVELTNGMVPKGSIACDGISLTIVDLTDGEFSVHIIPHTVAGTNLQRVQVGFRVNLEADMLGKYVARLVQISRSSAGS